MNDILGLGKILPIDKLIDIVSSVTGKLSKSYFDRKDVDTKAYEIKKLAEARADEMKIISNAIKGNFLSTGGIEYKENNLLISSPKSKDIPIEIDFPLEERIQERLNHKEIQKQFNIESVTSYAAEQLANEPEIENTPINEDWKTRFFSIAEDISNDEMQALWGRILAGEIKKPKSYSLRTLELLKNISKEDAECFMKFGELAITSDGTSFIIDFNKAKLLEEKYNLKFEERLLLSELGILTATDLHYKLYQNDNNDTEAVFTTGKYCIVVKRKKGTPQTNIPVLAFTKLGNELLQLIDRKPQLDYLQLFASKIKQPNITIQYATILNVNDGLINHTGLIDIPDLEEETK